MIPSVKTLAQITSYPTELRKVLEATSLKTLQDMLSAQYGATQGWVASCYHYPGFFELKMSMADELCETHGKEYIKRGKGTKSPSIHYLNAGDPYITTLLYVRGNYRVGCWGDIVERGNYA